MRCILKLCVPEVVMKFDFFLFFFFQASFDAGLADLSEEQYDVHAVTGLDISNILQSSCCVSCFM